MFLPVVPVCMGRMLGGEMGGICASVLLFWVGICLPAPFCNYWLDAYRRKNVALWALVGIVCATMAFLFDGPQWVRGVARMMQGASYCVFQIALGSTLLLDLSDTKKRTEAAHVYYWFTRLALVFGPLSGIVLPVHYGVRLFAGVSEALLLCAGVLIVTMCVPFRAPLEPSWCTFDRFWLPRGFRLFIPLAGVAFSAGLMLGQYRDAGFYLFLAVGFWLALWGHHFFFRGKLQTELAVGFVVLSASALLWGLGGDMEGMEWSIALCLGSGLGFVTSRYLLSYIRICEHCERGTAQTSYLLGWDAGLWAGYSVSFGLRTEVGETIYTYIMGAIFVGMGMFHLFWTRLWYMRNKRK